MAGEGCQFPLLATKLHEWRFKKYCGQLHLNYDWINKKKITYEPRTSCQQSCIHRYTFKMVAASTAWSWFKLNITCWRHLPRMPKVAIHRNYFCLLSNVLNVFFLYGKFIDHFVIVYARRSTIEFTIEIYTFLHW